MAKTDLSKALLKRFDRLSSQRQNWETHWQEVADYMIEIFDLYSHYDINPESRKGQYNIKRKFFKLYQTQKTK